MLVFIFFEYHLFPFYTHADASTSGELMLLHIWYRPIEKCKNNNNEHGDLFNNTSITIDESYVNPETNISAAGWHIKQQQ